ncbi:DUF4440 domain-containing protein [Pedobacter sp. KBW06]|nr:DUF4440 domain-containing protein [Pedobacter sp. KBW06]
MKISSFYFLKLTFLICFLSVTTKGQVAKPASGTLYANIAHMDSVLFNAFNTRALDTLKVLFSKDIEFYHDSGGLTDYKQNMDAFEETFRSERKLRRELVAGSLEVSPINGYGAVATGIHRFYATEKGKKEQLSSEAKFLMLWRLWDGKWKTTRIISFGHQEYLNRPGKP